MADWTLTDKERTAWDALIAHWQPIFQNPEIAPEALLKLPHAESNVAPSLIYGNPSLFLFGLERPGFDLDLSSTIYNAIQNSDIPAAVHPTTRAAVFRDAPAGERVSFEIAYRWILSMMVENQMASLSDTTTSADLLRWLLIGLDAFRGHPISEVSAFASSFAQEIVEGLDPALEGTVPSKARAVIVRLARRSRTARKHEGNFYFSFLADRLIDASRKGFGPQSTHEFGFAIVRAVQEASTNRFGKGYLQVISRQFDTLDALMADTLTMQATATQRVAP